MLATAMAYHPERKRAFDADLCEAVPISPTKRTRFSPELSPQLHHGSPNTHVDNTHLPPIPEELATRHRVGTSAMDSSLPTESLLNGPTNIGNIIYPDIIELPANEEEDMLETETPNEDDRWDPQEPSRQGQRLADTNIKKVVLPLNFAHTIPSVILGTPKPPKLAQFEDRSGPIIEEIPYNSLALVPYSPIPQIILPPSSPRRDQPVDSSQEERSIPESQEDTFRDAAEDDNGDGSGAMDVIPMLTPPDAGGAFGMWPGEGVSSVNLMSQDSDVMEMED